MAISASKRASPKRLRYEGMTHLFAGRFADAERCTTEALSLFQKVGNSSGEAWARQNLAWIAFVQGMISEAESRLGVASQLFEELGNQSGLAWSRGLLAFVRMHQGRFDEAEEIATQALRDARERADRWAEGMMQTLRSAVCLWTGRTELAIRRAESALSSMRSIEDVAGELQAAAFLGRALVLAGRVNDGFQLFADCELRQLGTEAAGVAQLIRAGAAASAVAIGDPNEARRWLSDVDPSLLDPALVGQGDRLVAYGLAALQEGDLKTARDMLERAVYAEGDAGANPSAQAALALAALMDDADDAVPALTSAVERSPRATYADRWLSAVGGRRAAGRTTRRRDRVHRGHRPRATHHVAGRRPRRTGRCRAGAGRDERSVALARGRRRGATSRRSNHRARYRSQRLARRVRDRARLTPLTWAASPGADRASSRPNRPGTSSWRRRWTPRER